MTHPFFVRRPGLASTPNTPTPTPTQSFESIDIDEFDDGISDLTTAVSGETPTLPSDEPPSIRAINEAIKAADEVAFDLAVARIPQEHKVKIGQFWYIKYDFYRHKKSKKNAWYWEGQGIEVICISKG